MCFAHENNQLARIFMKTIWAIRFAIIHFILLANIPSAVCNKEENVMSSLRMTLNITHKYSLANLSQENLMETTDFLKKEITFG